MPFVQRIIEPVFLSRPTQQTTTASAAPTTTDESTSTRANQHHQPQPKSQQFDDFTTIANCTLANVLRQLASVVLVADEILGNLGDELQSIRIRSERIRKRIIKVEKTIENIEETSIYKPDKKNFVDSSDVLIYKTKRAITTSLFTPDTRPDHINRLYETAVATPVVPICIDDTDSNDLLSAAASFGATRHRITNNIDADIDTRMPAAIEDLRKWTSSEAIGEITVAPNCLARVGKSSLHNSTIAEESYASFSTSYVDGIDVTSTSTNDMVDAPNDLPIDHKLPSPEEQQKSLAQRYPAVLVSVNTSNVRFERMCSIRKSLGHMPMGKTRYVDDGQPVRRSGRKKPSGKRRNTIAGTDDKDIKEAFTQIRHSAIVGTSSTADSSQAMPRSKSNDLLRSNGTIDSLRSSNRFSNFKALKQWGKHRLKLSITKINEARIDEGAEHETPQANANNSSNDSVKLTKPKPKTQAEKMLKQNPLYSSSEKLFPSTNVEPEIRKCTTVPNPVKLRTSMTRRQRRNKQYRCEEPNSSSGNWSASSESGRTSASSEIAMHNKSSASCTSLNHSKPPMTLCPPALTKRRINTSTSSSITSDETLTHDIPSSGYIDYDDETSSMYSCDTEGYFTSFHVDSGLKTLKEEETLTAVPALISTSALINESSVSSSIGDSLHSMSRTTNSISDSDYELFGKGSTSTTASSAGTVCTTLLGSLSNNSLVETPVAPERKSSLNSKLSNISNYAKPKVLLNKHDSILSNMSKDNDTSRNLRSPFSITANMDAMVSNAVPLATFSDLEISETSDFEGVEHIERMHGKTKINTNRIPSICVITPSHSDDEDRVAAMESMLSSLNINQNGMLMGEMDDEMTIAQVHAVHADENDNNLSNLVKWTTPTLTAKFPIEKSLDQTDGEYVTITDVATYPNTYRYDDNVDNNLEQILSDNLNLTTEYVSLNELPCNMNYNRSKNLKNGKNTKLIDGKNVQRNANGMFVYDSNTLRYKRSLCTTFKGISSDDVNKPNNVSKTNDKMQQTTNADKGVSQDGSPPFDKMASHSSLHSLDDVYVTLAVDRNSTTKNAQKAMTSTEAELSDSSKDLKSYTWPLPSRFAATAKTPKRRFSWENLIKTPKNVNLFRKRTSNKLNMSSSFIASKSQSKPAFKTSTPLKEARDSVNTSNTSTFANNTSIVHNNRHIEAQRTTCSDRMGSPKTSLNEFKKLLLNANIKKAMTSSKPSAVELLKLKQDVANSTPIKILDLSASPKLFTNRRLFQHSQASSSSHGQHKKINVLSPRSRWKHNNFNKSYISSIPEAIVEDDMFESKPTESPPIRDKSNSPDSKSLKTMNDLDRAGEMTPSTSKNQLIIAETESSPETGIIETNFSMKDNIFLQIEENNFMPGEVKPFATGLRTHQNGPAKPIRSHHIQSTEPTTTTPPPSLETSF